MKRARCLSFWICLRIIQHFKIHAKVQYTTVTSSAQSKLNCNIIAMSAARFSHLLVIWCLLSNTKCATWKVETIWNSLSLSIFIYIYGMYRFFIFCGNHGKSAWSILHLPFHNDAFHPCWHWRGATGISHLRSWNSCSSHCLCRVFVFFLDGFDGFFCVHSRRPSWKSKPFGFPELYMAQFWRCESLLLG